MPLGKCQDRKQEEFEVCMAQGIPIKGGDGGGEENRVTEGGGRGVKQGSGRGV